MSELHAAKDTHAKALAINLEASIYGSFAEIGAGQEVARWFLTVGGGRASQAGGPLRGGADPAGAVATCSGRHTRERETRHDDGR